MRTDYLSGRLVAAGCFLVVFGFFAAALFTVAASMIPPGRYILVALAFLCANLGVLGIWLSFREEAIPLE